MFRCLFEWGRLFKNYMVSSQSLMNFTDVKGKNKTLGEGRFDLKITIILSNYIKQDKQLHFNLSKHQFISELTNCYQQEVGADEDSNQFILTHTGYCLIPIPLVGDCLQLLHSAHLPTDWRRKREHYWICVE